MNGSQDEGKTVSEIIAEVAKEICTHYCKYPDIWDEDEAEEALHEGGISQGCPLNRL